MSETYQRCSNCSSNPASYACISFSDISTICISCFSSQLNESTHPHYVINLSHSSKLCSNPSNFLKYSQGLFNHTPSSTSLTQDSPNLSQSQSSSISSSDLDYLNPHLATFSLLSWVNLTFSESNIKQSLLAGFLNPAIITSPLLKIQVLAPSNNHHIPHQLQANSHFYLSHHIKGW